MDCNKEEAFKAKGLAEKKLQAKDFIGARKFALKAQQLNPELENISQMLMVCDVHCSAEKRVVGNEMDWYAILQVEQAADEATIKKQYRKFALCLHPDKNKFAGAEAAFKLVGEAQRVLLDRDKRSLHDSKRNASVCRTASHNVSFSRPTAHYTPTQKVNLNVVQNNSTSRFPRYNTLNQQQQRPARAGSKGQQTFWTMCPFCNVRYQYYIHMISKVLMCQNCKKTYVAYDLNMPSASMCNMNRPTFLQQNSIPSQHYCKVEVGSGGTSKSQDHKAEVFQKMGTNARVVPGKASKKRGRKREVVSSESAGSTSSEEVSVIAEDGDLPGGQSFVHTAYQPVRRSTRQRQRVSYRENISDDDDDDFAVHKKTKGRQQRCSEKDYENGFEKEASKSNGEEVVADNLDEGLQDDKSTPESSETEADSKVYQYPDPEFHDFDNIRKKECFAAGQVWAIYDVCDGMPRFYACINKICHPGFKVEIVWLEPNPDDENETNWANMSLPVSCGKFTCGNTQNIEDIAMFSHPVSWKKGKQKNTFFVYPIKGETWALFKDWDINWYSNPAAHKKFEYEFVEILTEFSEDDGVLVAWLGKVKGFSSLFCRIGRGGTTIFQIPPAKLYRFAHKVPSFKMTGEEREGVPKGSFELDPASVTGDLEEIDPCKGMKVDNDGVRCNVDTVDIEDSSVKEEECLQDSMDFSSDPVNVPDPVFFKFDQAKFPENYDEGQIWALYADEDGLPKYYGCIIKLERSPQFRVHLQWLISCSLPDSVIQWCEKDMLICCGKFKVKRCKPCVYEETDTFSHCLKAKSMAGNNSTYSIYPEKGEVWALYKNWHSGMTRLEMKKCEYNIIEVIEKDDVRIKVLNLERVEGFSSVFKPQVEQGSKSTLEIPFEELLRFSHQIPAFQLTEERNGSLRGFWELDTSALPLYFFT